LSTYTQSLRLFRELNVADQFIFPYPGKIHFVSRDGMQSVLREWPLPAPFNLVAGLLCFDLLPWKSRLKSLAISNEILHGDLPAQESAESWLDARSSPREREIFWHPLIHAALNAPAQAVPATYLKVIFKQGFCRGFWGGRLGYAVQPLGEIFGARIQTRLEETGITVRLRATAWGGVLTQDDKPRLCSVLTGKEETIPCDAVVVALPPWSLADWLNYLSPTSEKGVSMLRPPHLLEDWQANPIVTIYLWAENRPLLESYTALPGRSVGWVFDYARLWDDRRAPLALMLDLQADMDRRDTQVPHARSYTRSRYPLDVDRIFADLFSAFPQLKPVLWTTWKIIRERRSTPLRPKRLWGETVQQTTAIPNVFLAGDWLDPELPPTVEAAVRTGARVRQLISEIS
jgi:hypothetical protein